MSVAAEKPLQAITDNEEPAMTITVAHTSATVADIAGFTPLALVPQGSSEVVVVARATSVRRRRPLIVPRRHRAAASVALSASSDLVEVTVVRSPRNRVGGGARARPTTTW